MLGAVLVAALTCAAGARAQTLVDVAVGKHNGCALYDDGSVWCWGAEILPESPDEPVFPFRASRIPDLGRARSIAVGRVDACAVLDDGSVWCWGTDLQATARRGAHVQSFRPVLVEGLPPVAEVSLGFVHHCALALDATVWCWGFNPLGELGDGGSGARWQPRKVEGIGPAIAVAAGVNNSCAVETDGNLKCWGTYDPTQNLEIGEPWDTILNSRVPVSLPVSGLASVANGRNFGCGLLRSGHVACWGSNVLKQLGTHDDLLSNRDFLGGFGIVSNVAQATDLDVDYFHACAVSNGTVWCWGAPYDKSQGEGALPYRVPGLKGATRVATGESHSCALAGDDVLCWGWGCAPAGGEASCWGWKREMGEILPGMTPSTPVPVPDLPPSR